MSIVFCCAVVVVSGFVFTVGKKLLSCAAVCVVLYIVIIFSKEL